MIVRTVTMVFADEGGANFPEASSPIDAMTAFSAETSPLNDVPGEIKAYTVPIQEHQQPAMTCAPRVHSAIPKLGHGRT